MPDDKWRIWKYSLELTDFQSVEMPSGSHVLHVGLQDEKITIWVKAMTDQPLEKRGFAIVGTGNPMSIVAITGKHVGTVFQGPFVWHVFDCCFSNSE